MTVVIGLALAGMAIILIGVIRLILTTPDILLRGMEPARWRRALTNLTILWVGLGVLNLASAILSGPTAWYNAALIIFWAALGVLLGRHHWTAHRTRQTHR